MDDGAPGWVHIPMNKDTFRGRVSVVDCGARGACSES